MARAQLEDVGASDIDCRGLGPQVAVKVARAPVFVAGRYRKLGRDISNSPWLPGKCVTSVSEELARGLLPAMRADSYKFNSAGVTRLALSRESREASHVPC